MSPLFLWAGRDTVYPYEPWVRGLANLRTRRDKALAVPQLEGIQL